VWLPRALGFFFLGFRRPVPHSQIHDAYLVRQIAEIIL
jgi:hypothetical protein